MAPTEYLKSQWINPSDVANILMIIGGDVVQHAFAQGTGKPYTPVCFSFGCVAYAFTTLVNIIGDGRLLPRPDYAAKVFNLESGCMHESKSWVVGRLLRDLEMQISRDRHDDDDLGGVRISVFEALENENKPTEFSWGTIHGVGAFVTLVQLALAAIPIILDRDWTVMMIAVAGTILVQVTGILPQWKAEKLPNRQNSKINFALTTGNGAHDIVVILGRGNCLNLVELADSRTPRSARLWKKFEQQPEPSDQEKAQPEPTDRKNAQPKSTDEERAENTRRQSRFKKTNTFRGTAYGFWITRVICSALFILWLLLLISLTAVETYTWFILGVGAVGMLQNAWLAAVEMPSKQRNVPLYLIDTIKTHKTMDGIMDFDTTYGRGLPLLEEFFPSGLRPNEIDWWAGNKGPYEEERRAEAARGMPRPPQPFETSTLSFLEETQMPWADDERPVSAFEPVEYAASKRDRFRARARALRSQNPTAMPGSASRVMAPAEAQHAIRPQSACATSPRWESAFSEGDRASVIPEGGSKKSSEVGRSSGESQTAEYFRGVTMTPSWA